MNSLHTSDVFQLIFICAVIFIPVGFVFATYIVRRTFIVKFIAKIQTKLTDKGSFSDYLNGGQQ